MKNEVLVTIPNYLETFQCIGGDCSDTCCKGWDISVDQKTFKKYRELQHSDLGRRLKEAVKKNEGKKGSFDHYASIKLQKDTCPFLTCERRCEVQEKIGESYLSTTCRSYPRKCRKVDQGYELIGVLSCPEIAKKVLLDSNAFEMSRVFKPEKELKLYNQPAIYKNVQVSFRIRDFLIHCLEDGSKSLKHRLMTVVMFAQLLSEIEQENLDSFIGEFEVWRQSMNAQEEFMALEKMMDLGLSLKSYLSFGRSQIFKLSAVTRFTLIFNESLKGFIPTDGVDALSLYQASLRKSETVEGNSFDQLLARYAIHTIYSKDVVFSPQNALKEVGGLLVRLSFFRTLWAGLTTSMEELTNEELVKSIQLFSRHYDHHQGFNEMIEEQLTQVNEIGLQGYLSLINC